MSAVADWPTYLTREALWEKDHLAQSLGIEIIDAAPGRAVARLHARDTMTNGTGVVHGAIAYALADTVFGFAANLGQTMTLTHSAEIRYHSPVQVGEVLEAVCTERWREGRRGVYDAAVRVGDRLVAEYVGHATVVRPPGSGDSP